MGWNMSMLILEADDPGDGLLDALDALGLAHDDRPSLVGFDAAAGSDFRGLGIAARGRCVIVVGDMAHERGPDAAPAFERVLSLYASENRGGTNELRIFERGDEVAAWIEADGGATSDHPLLPRPEPDEHPFDFVQRAVENVLGAKPTDLVELRLVHFPRA